MPTTAGDSIYRAAPGLSWVVQSHGVLVVDDLARQATTLSYPEAAVWELLLRGHTADHSGVLLQWIMGLPAGAAQAAVADAVTAWSLAGWIVAVSVAEEG